MQAVTDPSGQPAVSGSAIFSAAIGVGEMKTPARAAAPYGMRPAARKTSLSPGRRSRAAAGGSLLGCEMSMKRKPKTVAGLLATVARQRRELVAMRGRLEVLEHAVLRLADHQCFVATGLDVVTDAAIAARDQANVIVQAIESERRVRTLEPGDN